MNRGDRVTVRFDAPGQEDWPTYAGTVLDLYTPSDMYPRRTAVEVVLDEDPPIISGWLRDAPRTWWFVSEQVAPIE